MSANLVIVNSNPQPDIQRDYPIAWLVYTQGQELQVHVERDRDYKPHVLDKGAA